MGEYTALFTPGQFGTLTLKNRVMMAPMVRNYADANGEVTAKYLAHIERIARGGVGALILEASYVRPDGKGFVNELGIYDDKLVPGLRELVQAAHRQGAAIGPQLYHAGRQTSSAITGMQPVAPSAIPDPTINEIPHALEVGEIQALVHAYAQGARRAKEAGCDFVEIHGAHGYLITQFLSPFSNMREDEYGGTPEKRLRLLVEIIEAIRESVGLDFPLGVRLSGEEQVPNGLTIDDTVYIARRLESLRVNALHISAGNYASYVRGYMISPMALPDGPLLPLAKTVKEAVSIPVIAVGKIRTPELADEVIRTGQADFVALGRPLLADHDWPRKAESGQSDRIDKCIACNQGCITRLFDQLDVWCTVNPETSREIEFARPPTAAKTVVIAGGGPAGMEAARVAVGRGHRVALFEQEDHLGGQLIAAAAAPYRPGWRELNEFLQREMQHLGVDVRLSTQLTPELARQHDAEVAIVATGSLPIRLKIPGIGNENVITARDLLEGRVTAKGRVVVAGGGCAGVQTAEYLATQGHPVTIVEMMGAIAPDAPSAERELLIGRLGRLGVKIQMETKIMRIGQGEVAVERPGGEDRIPADTVVICLGSAPNDVLVEALRPVVPTVLVVGDAVKARKVTDAMVDGALAALML